MQHLLTAFAGLVSAVCGAAIGVLFTVAHRASVEVAGLEFPYGIVLGVACAIGFLAALRLLWETRWPTVGGAIGLVVAIVVLAFTGPGGSVIVAADALGWTWLILPPIIAVAAIAWPRMPRRRVARRPAGAADAATMDGPEQPAEETP